MEKQQLIPTQQVGQQTDAEKVRTFPTVKEAIEFYQTAKNRLLDVNSWQCISSIEASRFSLYDAKGSPILKKAAQGDFIRIDIPGPGTEEGNGYDWVHIEYLEELTDEQEDEELIFFIARPSQIPGEVIGHTAHFFSPKATSTFMVFRRGSEVWAEVHGRNELPNLSPDSIFDKARNLMVNGGSAVGMSFAQWELLISGILA